MTSNHRPALENKRGKKLIIGNSISHARSLPQQLHIKYRVKKPYYPITKKDVTQVTQNKQIQEIEHENHQKKSPEKRQEESEEESEGESDNSTEDDAELVAELAKLKQSKTPKSSWRKSAFNNSQSSQPKQYTTKSIDSEQHQQFLSKYIQ